MIEPNTGGMDTSGPPVSLAKASKAQRGGNFSVAEGVTSHKGDLASPELTAGSPAFQSRRGAVEARLAHNQEVVGPNPTAATDVMPDRRAYDPPAGGRPVNYTENGST